MLPYEVPVLRYYLTAGGESPFESWFSDLDAAAAAKVTVALARLEQGSSRPFDQGSVRQRLVALRPGPARSWLLQAPKKPRVL